MKLKDLIKSIDIKEDSIIMHPKYTPHWPIIEYLQNILNSEIDTECLSTVNSLLANQNHTQLENHIINHFIGFSNIDGTTCAYLVGAMDIGVGVYLNWQDKSPFFYHPNTKEKLHSPVSISELIELILQFTCLKKCLNLH